MIPFLRNLSEDDISTILALGFFVVGMLTVWVVASQLSEGDKPEDFEADE